MCLVGRMVIIEVYKLCLRKVKLNGFVMSMSMDLLCKFDVYDY